MFGVILNAALKGLVILVSADLCFALNKLHSAFQESYSTWLYHLSRSDIWYNFLPFTSSGSTKHIFVLFHSFSLHSVWIELGIYKLCQPILVPQLQILLICQMLLASLQYTQGVSWHQWQAMTRRDNSPVLKADIPESQEYQPSGHSFLFSPSLADLTDLTFMYLLSLDTEVLRFRKWSWFGFKYTTSQQSHM